MLGHTFLMKYTLSLLQPGIFRFNPQKRRGCHRIWHPLLSCILSRSTTSDRAFHHRRSDRRLHRIHHAPHHRPYAVPADVLH